LAGFPVDQQQQRSDKDEQNQDGVKVHAPIDCAQRIASGSICRICDTTWPLWLYTVFHAGLMFWFCSGMLGRKSAKRNSTK
jgi:hypothetical protein